MFGIKYLITDYARAVAQYHGTDPLLRGRCSECAARAASTALAIALRSTEHRTVWSEISMEWAQRAHPHSAAVA